jgi:beta-lactamase regulating signal transducer with metallopeptidase domain
MAQIPAHFNFEYQYPKTKPLKLNYRRTYDPSGKYGFWLIVEVALMVAMELIDVIKDHLQKKRGE